MIVSREKESQLIYANYLLILYRYYMDIEKAFDTYIAEGNGVWSKFPQDHRCIAFLFRFQSSDKRLTLVADSTSEGN